METSHANIWYNPDQYKYLIYSPKDGVTDILEMYVGVWGDGKVYKSDTYQTMEDLEQDAVHYNVVTTEGLRQTLLKAAKDFYDAD